MLRFPPSSLSIPDSPHFKRPFPPPFRLSALCITGTSPGLHIYMPFFAFTPYYPTTTILVSDNHTRRLPILVTEENPCGWAVFYFR